MSVLDAIVQWIQSPLGPARSIDGERWTVVLARDLEQARHGEAGFAGAVARRLRTLELRRRKGERAEVAAETWALALVLLHGRRFEAAHEQLDIGLDMLDALSPAALRVAIEVVEQASEHEQADGRAASAIVTLEHAISAPAGSPHARLRWLARLAYVHASCWHAEAAIAACREGLALLEAAAPAARGSPFRDRPSLITDDEDGPARKAVSLSIELATALAIRGDLDEANVQLEQLEKTMGASLSAYERCSLVYARGWAAYRAGSFEAAGDFFAQAVESAEAASQRGWLVFSLESLGWTQLEREQVRQPRGG